MRFLWALKQQFRFLLFSTGVQNAQLFENSVLEYKRNQILLNLARSIFEEQNNLECLVTKIMKEARDLLKCERCAVFLVDLECCEEVIPFFLLLLLLLASLSTFFNRKLPSHLSFFLSLCRVI